MQTVCLPKGKPADYFLQQQKREQDEEKMLYFPLDGMLPAGDTLVLNTALSTLSYLSRGIDCPRLEKQQQFTSSELSLLRPLLELFPHYCPYEVMFASFYNGTINEVTVDLFDFGDGVYSDGDAKRKVRICCIGGYCATCHKTRVLRFFSSKVLHFANLLCTLCTIYMFLTKIYAPKIFSRITVLRGVTPCKEYLSVK